MLWNTAYPIKPFICEDFNNTAEIWQTFKKDFDDHFLATDLDEKTPEKQLAMFRILLVPQRRKILQSLKVEAQEPSKLLQASLDEMTKYLEGQGIR